MTRSDAGTDIDAFAAALPPAGALLGLDLGTKTIGLALSDPRRQIASPIGGPDIAVIDDVQTKFPDMIDQRAAAKQ